MPIRERIHRNRRLTKSAFAIALALSLLFGLTGFSAAQTGQPASFIVQGRDSQTVALQVEACGGEVSSLLDVIRGAGALLSPQALTCLEAQPEITAITPNGAVRLAQTSFKARKQSVPATDYPDVTGADLVWEQGVTGEGIAVAVVDTGIANHPGLQDAMGKTQKGRLKAWVDFVEQSPSPRDPNGHGTHIAGIIANSQMGPDGEWNGVAPGANLVGVRVLDEQGSGTYERVIQGVQWVIEHKDQFNIKVMNLSLVASVQSPYWADPLNQAVMQAWGAGITVVVAAGNGGPQAMTIGVPGNNPYVITVGAFTDNYTPYDWSDDYLAPFSAAGPTLDGFAKPDLVAPGAHMVSTMLPSSYIARNHTANQATPYYFSMAGTSQAAAVVSGIAALTLSHNPELNPDQVKYRLMYTSFPWVDAETFEAVYSLWQQGAGRVNAPDAVFTDVTEEANLGMNLLEDLAGNTHYEGYSYYDEAAGEFRLKGEFNDWTGGYGAWAGGYEPATGDYATWAEGYGVWAGGYGVWAGGYGVWAGGYGAWAGGYGAWAGSYGDMAFAERFVNWRPEFVDWMGSLPWSGTWVDFDG